MDAAAFAPRRLWPHEKLTPRRHQKLTAPTEEGMIEMLLGQSSPLRGDLVGGEMPAPDEVTAVVGRLHKLAEGRSELPASWGSRNR